MGIGLGSSDGEDTVVGVGEGGSVGTGDVGGAAAEHLGPDDLGVLLAGTLGTPDRSTVQSTSPEPVGILGSVLSCS